MGIDGLWKVFLEPIEQKISLPNLAVGTGFIANTTGQRGYRVGIDASGWMYRACARHGILESPELVALFSRCSRLFRFPFIPVFAFDGPERPKIKRGKVIRGNEHWLTSSFQRMLDGFGFDCFQAAGEAEATLSMMTTTGIPFRVDAILTDDSDSFVFGASDVLRIRSEDNENYEASLYSAHDISMVLGLSREDLILIAVLAGGDYSDGLAQCGITTAIALARAGLGKQLVLGLSNRSLTHSASFLETWRESLRSELSTNASGHLPHRYASLAAAIPSDFPDVNVVNLYLHPVVSEPLRVARHLVFQPPRFDILARFAEDHFGWGNSVGILTHFADQLFAGLVIRELTQRALAADQLAALPNLPSLIKSVVRDRAHKSTGHLSELRLMLNVDPTILTTALQAIAGRRDPPLGAQSVVTTWITTALPKVRVWVPKSMVEHVYPAMVLDYMCATAKPSSRKKPQIRKKTAPNTIDTTTLGPSSSSATTANSGHAAHNALPSTSSGRTTAHTPREKRYTTMSVTY
ncbi:PIN domain-like protein [Mycena galericulata]|nr:PIN domain-like protein [Mycena galericulata]